MVQLLSMVLETHVFSGVPNKSNSYSISHDLLRPFGWVLPEELVVCRAWYFMWMA